MSQQQDNKPPLSRPVKVVYVALALICVLIGIAGLLLPVIPGLLFLVAALYLIGKVSVRVKTWSESRPMLVSLHARLHKLEQVSLGERLKLVGLTVAALALGLITRSARLARGVMSRVPRSFRNTPRS
ncbi:MAG: DUF454 family protein [SAR86 cluster bacterium]|jgi:uncharacterized membrane protein YbaN (DUF454 family)|tara:strand:+ start:214 stop:597 length:384 start_codon:yes stop_codon:yes gene_type:complete